MACDLGDLFIHHTLLPVRQSRKLTIDVVQLFAIQIEAEILAALLQRVPAAVLAEDQFTLRHTNRLRVDDFICRALFQVSVLVDTGFMRESIPPNNRLIRLRAEGDDGTQELACRKEMFGLNTRL